jgi:hypothetical protein
LTLCNYLARDKTVQTLAGVLSVASRPSCCRHATCAGSNLRLVSAEAQGLALPGSTYGYEVLVRMGWWRQQYHATYREVHPELAARLHISESHVRHLYQQAYLPLLACHDHQHRDRLAQVAKQHGGLIIALDGLAPQAGEPQIWFIRELSSGLTLRSGWLAQQDQTTFEAFLEPLKHLEWPVLAVLSDKQTGLRPALATNAPSVRLSLAEAVLCYRHEYRIERMFNRLKSRLQISPLFVKRDDQIEGLTYLLTLGVRVLTVMEFTLQRSLQREQASLAGLHLENCNKCTDKPSAERALKAFFKVTLTIMTDGEGRDIGRWLTPLSAVQQDILYQLGLEGALYFQLEIHNTSN